MLNSNNDPNWQVNFFNQTFLNIMSNFIPNKTIKIDPKDPPWINCDLKNMLKRQNRMYKNFKRHGFSEADRDRVQRFREYCNQAVRTAKEKYLRNIWEKLSNPNTSQKYYWSLIHKLLNKQKNSKNTSLDR